MRFEKLKPYRTNLFLARSTQSRVIARLFCAPRNEPTAASEFQRLKEGGIAAVLPLFQPNLVQIWARLTSTHLKTRCCATTGCTALARQSRSCSVNHGDQQSSM